MIKNNFAFFAGKIVAEIFGIFVYFPIWWYTRGLFNVFTGIIEFIKAREKSLGLLVWVKNVFKPMYGQRDIQGWLISVVMRIIQIIFRGFLMIIYIIIAFAVLALWVSFPIFVFMQIIFQFT